MARLWLRNFAQDVSDHDLSTFLAKYGFPRADAIDVFEDGQESCSALVRYPGVTTSKLTELVSRIGDVFWRGHSLDAQVAIPVG